MSQTPIQAFYNGKIIFMTGGTGFLGKTLTEKLLRTCSDIGKIIILMRPRGSKSFETRKQEYFHDVLFDGVKNTNPNVLDKVDFVNGDVTKPNLGIDNKNYEKLINSVNVIFHIAATLNFTSPLHVAVPINILSVQYILAMAKQTKHLQALIHTSTAYSHIILDVIEENITPNLSYSAEFLLQLIKNTDKKTLDKITPTLLGEWPNTYVITKYAAECYINAEKGDLPIAIFRPGAVMSTYREPIPGWTNNYNTAMGLSIGVGMGIIKLIRANPEHSFQIIPVDMVVNCMLAIGWDIQSEQQSKMKIYNYTSQANPLLMKPFFDYSASAKFVTEKAVWYPGCSFTNCSTALYNKYLQIFFETPAAIGDVILKIFHKQPKYKAFYTRYSTLLKVVNYFFTTTNRIFEHQNALILWNKLDSNDKKLFNFDVTSINWDNFLVTFFIGLKTFLLKENVHNTEKAIQKRRRLFVTHYLCLLIIILFVIFLFIKLAF